MSQPATPATPPAPPSVPRHVTPVVSKRSWSDPRVRFCWLGATILLIIFAFFFTQQTWLWLSEKNVIEHGSPVKATVLEAGGFTLESQQAAHDSDVKLEYEYNGKTFDVEGYLFGREETIRPKSTVEIRVDPNNPEKWTYRKQPADLLGNLLADLSLLPLVIAIIGVAIFLRNRVLKTWTTAPAQLAVVMETSQSPIAPMSTNLKCALTESRDKSLHMVSVPNKYGPWKKGDVIWLLVPTGGKGFVVPAVSMMADGK